MKVVLGKRGGEATKRRRLWHSRATARVSSEKTGQNSALCATINVNPERSSERRSLFVRSPRINPNSRLPPCVLHSNSSLLNGGTIHVPSERRRVSIVRRVSPRVFQIVWKPGAEYFAYSNLASGTREGEGRVQRDYSAAADPARPRGHNRAPLRAEKRRRGGKRESLRREEGSFFFLFTTKLTLVQFFLFF